MGKAGIIVLGAVIIGTALGMFFSNTYGLLPSGGLPLLCALVGLIASASLVTIFEAVRKRMSAAAAESSPATSPLAASPPAVPSPIAPTDKAADRVKP